jgi:hypothetical protein
VGYLADIISDVNNLNISVQGNDKTMAALSGTNCIQGKAKAVDSEEKEKLLPL